MITAMPFGWKYLGVDYTGKHNSYVDKSTADHEVEILQKRHPNIDFDIIPHDDRWIIIVKKDSYNGIFRKKSNKKSNRCKCKK